MPADPRAALAGLLLQPGAAVPKGVFRTAPGHHAEELARRIAIHRNTVTVALVDALAALYPAVETLVGTTFFRAAAREFARQHPPASPVLADYGGGFGDFLSAFPPATGLPYLADVAALEWLWAQASTAAEAVPVGIDRLGVQGGAAAARLRFHPSVALLRSAHPAVSLWRENTGRAARTRLDLAVAETALVARPGRQVEVYCLDPPTAAFLGALLAGATLGGATEAAMAAPGFDLHAQLAAMFEAGLVIAADAGPASGPGCSPGPGADRNHRSGAQT